MVWMAASCCPAAEIDFARTIRPILSDKCFVCHGPDKGTLKAGLRLDQRELALRENDGITAIVPGDAEQSEMVKRIFATNEDDRMPPADAKNPLSESERQALKNWIEQGAPYEGHWAFQPISKPPEPQVKHAARRRSPIDSFVLAKLEQEGFEFAEDARKERLIRRVAFDLTGLPPTPEEIDGFLADSSSGAFGQVVGEYLSRKTYGERMASEWLDVARYSDTYGYQVDRDRFVWPYRDWVIKAFNRNLPYDQFITEQVAGDLIPNATDDQILATAFNRLHPQKVEGGSVPEEFRIEYVSDRTQTFATAFLGLTMECCKCHDHKYDPLAQAEFYGLSSFFDNIDEAGLYSFFTPSIPTPTLELRTEQHRAKLRELDAIFEKASRHEQDLTVTAIVEMAEPSTAVTQAIVEGLVGSFDFDERTGNTFENSARPDLSASTSAGNKTVPGKSGQALHLTGDDPVKLNVGNFTRHDPFSVALWMKTPKKFERAVVFHRSRAWTDAASRGYQLLIEDGSLSASLIHFWPGNAIRVRATEKLKVNEWVHVCISYDGSSRADGLQIWVNAQPSPQLTVRDNLTRNITGGGGPTIAIGARFRDRGFSQGLVDEFKVFDRALTRVEIEDLMNPGALAKFLKLKTEEMSAAQRTARSRYLAAFHPGLIAGRETLSAARKKRAALTDTIPEMMVMRERKTERQTYLLERGAYDARGREVSSVTPAALHSFPEQAPRNRYGLAQWLIDRQNPLTARVTVNRYWQMLFGRGLVKTANDFGSQGSLPSHPELLDWLTADFMDQGWDVKHLIRQMVMSTTYRQSTLAGRALFAKDPENLLLGRAPRYRLAAEMIRDNALYLSGLLVPKIGGASVKPYEVAESFKPSKPDSGDGLYRRSLYTYWKRTAPAPVMMALDAARRDVCSVSRETTATPLQAFVFMNDPQFVEAARKLAERALDENAGNAHQATAWMFRALTSRQPVAAEERVLHRMFDEQLALFTQDSKKATQFLKTGAAEVPKNHVPARLAALNIVASALLSHDECVMKR
jgi:hypothetical protein